MADGVGLTVMLAVLAHPVPSVYVIVARPTVTPLTVPVAATVAIEVLPLLHVPPAIMSPNEVVAPAHTFADPVITAGSGFVVTIVVAEQLFDVLYVITARPPVAPPVTIPDAEPTDATDKELLLHVPLGVTSDSVVVAPEQALVTPVIPAGDAFTVIAADLKQPEPIV